MDRTKDKEQMRIKAITLTMVLGVLGGLCGCITGEKKNQQPSGKIGPYGKNLAIPDFPLDSLPSEWI